MTRHDAFSAPFSYYVENHESNDWVRLVKPYVLASSSASEPRSARAPSKLAPGGAQSAAAGERRSGGSTRRLLHEYYRGSAVGIRSLNLPATVDRLVE